MFDDYRGLSFKNKVNTFKFKAKVKVDKAMDWVMDNREVLIVVAPFAIKGIKTVTRTGLSNLKIKKVEKLKNNYIYDRSGGHYWHMKREPRTDEWKTIDRRHKSGESYGDILESMKLI